MVRPMIQMTVDVILHVVKLKSSIDLCSVVHRFIYCIILYFILMRSIIFSLYLALLTIDFMLKSPIIIVFAELLSIPVINSSKVFCKDTQDKCGDAYTHISCISSNFMWILYTQIHAFKVIRLMISFYF